MEIKLLSAILRQSRRINVGARKETSTWAHLCESHRFVWWNILKHAVGETLFTLLLRLASCWSACWITSVVNASKVHYIFVSKQPGRSLALQHETLTRYQKLDIFAVDDNSLLLMSASSSYSRKKEAAPSCAIIREGKCFSCWGCDLVVSGLS